jgi:hypothetical protein
MPPRFAATLVFILYILIIIVTGGISLAMAVSVELCNRNIAAAFPGQPKAGHGMLGVISRTQRPA